jgi:soluble lytic murein transglycosylase-like protein
MPLKQHAAFLLFGLIATLGFTLGLAPGMGATAFAQEALPAGPITEQREVTDPPAPQAIDLTIPQDDLLARMRAGFAMPNLDSPLVLDRQIWYAARPSAIKHMVERSRRYLYHIVDELEKRGMPTELALLPMVESAFNPMAYSRAHAAGLWQFIPATGKRYDLSQNWWYDGRRDIVAATSAALDYLRDLYQTPGVAQTVNFAHFKNHYYQSHKRLNPSGIAPIGPAMTLDAPHGREAL